MELRITTFQRAHNYGAVLQVYALQEFLKKNYNVKVFDYENKKINLQYNPHILKRPTIKWTIKHIFELSIYRKKMFQRFDNFNKFINNYLNLTEKIENSSQINLDNVDAVITGSDQVWNSNLTGGLDDVYTINFGSNKLKRISYAASLGKNKIEENLQKEYKDKLSRIDKISVREESAKEALNKLLPNKEIEVVLDPTLLLTKDEWNKKINKNNSEKEKYILSYIVENNPEHTRIVDELSKNTGLKVIHFEKKKKYNRVLRSAYIDGPIEFINLIKNAEYVVTTSFHATVFSIIFNKKFWVVPHKTTGSRVTDLLDKFEISNRAIQSLEAFNKKKYDEEIDYKKVNKILEKEREKTIRWLTNAIEK